MRGQARQVSVRGCEVEGQDGALDMPQVMLFLQNEWRRYERERNLWEIEKAEMRVSCEHVKIKD